ncbi:MAG: prephenate dehydrogenase/arogenate dehydrogenase family protein [Verrucomicrobiota bacterium]
MAVLGPGLIGGSVLKAARASDPAVELRVWARREMAVAELKASSGLVDLATNSVSEVVTGADLVILAMPIDHMATVVEQFPRFEEGEGPIVTDVGSVKEQVVATVGALVREKGGSFLGSHPMAGSEKAGFENATPNLFENAAVILTPETTNSHEEITQLGSFWESLGAHVSALPADQHDLVVARVSHLPHLLSAALVRMVMLSDADAAVRYSAGGFRDTTRISAGPEEMWTGIFLENADAVKGELERLIEDLEKWRDALDTLDSDRLRSFLCEAREFRESLDSRG